MAKKVKSSKLSAKVRRAAYWTANRRNVHKANKLARRWKYYKVQPPKALKGLTDIMRNMVISRLN